MIFNQGFYISLRKAKANHTVTDRTGLQSLISKSVQSARLASQVEAGTCINITNCSLKTTGGCPCKHTKKRICAS
jgi:hypothetical protein